MASYPRHPADQPRRPARGGAPHPRSRLRADDWRTTPGCTTPPCVASGKPPARSTSPGSTVTLDPAGPLADAAWAKQRLGRATQALPNGYCGLPVQKTCPHANACLTCPMFLTTPEFLPQHRAQRQQTLQLVTAAEARGQQRLAEMNQQVLHNLDNIITALEEPGSRRTPNMRADNSIHLTDRRPTAARTTPAPRRSRRMHELHRAGAMLTFESVARTRRVRPAPGSTPKPTSKTRSGGCATRANTNQATPIPCRAARHRRLHTPTP